MSSSSEQPAAPGMSGSVPENAEVFLKRHIGRGHHPEEGHFGLRPCPVAPELANGQVRVRTLYLAISPSLRFALNWDSAATSSIAEGSVLGTDGVGLVVESTSRLFEVGDIIANKPNTLPWPWRKMVVFSDAQLIGVAFLVDSAGGEGWLRQCPEAAVSYFGLSALSSYLAMTDLLMPDTSAQGGQTLVVSGASGACGSIAGQIGKILGFSRVVGITSDAEKVAYITEELGYDAGIVCTGEGEELSSALAAACPGGADCYFDTVGGDVSAAVVQVLKEGSRVAVCGAMSQMAEGGKRSQNWVKSAQAQGVSVRWFSYTSYMDDDGRLSKARSVLQEWAESQRIRLRITRYEGLERAPACFVGLFTREKIGKALVHVDRPLVQQLPVEEAAVEGVPAAPKAPFPVSKNQLAAARGRLRSTAAHAVERPAAVPAAPAAAPSEQSFEIHLQFIGGESNDVLEVRPSDRMANVKSQVCAKLGISSARVKLVFGASVLKWNDTVDGSGISEGAVITVIILPPLYQGSEVYEKVATAYRDLQSDRPSEEEVHECLGEIMERRAKMNEAFTARIRLRQAEVA